MMLLIGNNIWNMIVHNILPNTEKLLNNSVSFKSVLFSFKYMIKAMPEESMMIKDEVPVAILIGMSINIVSMETIIPPPPIPAMVDMFPMRNPMIKSINMRSILKVIRCILND